MTRFWCISPETSLKHDGASSCCARGVATTAASGPWKNEPAHSHRELEGLRRGLRRFWAGGALGLMGCARVAQGAAGGEPLAASNLARVVLCAIATSPEGADVDDSGAAIDLVLEPAARRTRLGRVLSTCQLSSSPPRSNEIGTAECRDPHVDRVDRIRVLRPTPSLIVVEVTRQEEMTGRTTLGLHEEIAIDAGARVTLEAGGIC